MIMALIETKRQAAEYLGIPEYKILTFHEFQNGDWSYCDRNNHEHLYRFIDDQWIELTENILAMWVDSYPDGGWEYKDEKGFHHKFNKNNELIVMKNYGINKSQ